MEEDVGVSPAQKREAYYAARQQTIGAEFPEADTQAVALWLESLQTAGSAFNCVSRYFQEYGLSHSALNIMMILHGAPQQGRPLHELGELLFVTRANITGVVDSLVSAGLVRRSPDPKDRRVRYAVLTGKGTALMRRIGPKHHNRISLLLSGLNAKEKHRLTLLLRKMRHSIEDNQTGAAI